MFWTLCVFPCLSLSRSLGGKSTHVGGTGGTVHRSFPSTSFEIFIFASQGEACQFTLYFVGARGRVVVSFSALTERWPQGAVFIFQNLYRPARVCPRDGLWVLKSNIATLGGHRPGSSDQSSRWACCSASACACCPVGRPSGGCWVQVLSLSCTGVSISRNNLVDIIALMVHKEDISVWDSNLKR